VLVFGSLGGITAGLKPLVANAYFTKSAKLIKFHNGFLSNPRFSSTPRTAIKKAQINWALFMAPWEGFIT
jgi:hypothetical protein